MNGTCKPLKNLVLRMLVVLSLNLFWLTARAEDNSGIQKSSAAIIQAADTFLATLNDTQRSNVVYDFKDEAQRKRWSNLPVTMVSRGGLRLGDLSESQRKAALAVLAAALSPIGYEKVMGIVEGDEILKGNGGNPRPPDAKGGPMRNGGPRGGAMFGRDNYYISFLGQPSQANPWMIQFGGHHLGLNITLVGNHGTLAPSHTGSQPAIYELEGKTVRPLGRETDKAFALLSSLNDEQKKQAILGFEIRDLVLGPGRDGETIQPEGIRGSALSEQQQQMLCSLVSEWTGMLNEQCAHLKIEEVKNHISETWFAWSGPTEKGKAAYFRIQGPTVFIEYAPQRLGGDLTKHIHTIYRDPTNDYGVRWFKK